MRTIRTKVYQFSELNEKAQKTAIEKCRQQNWESGHNQIYFDEVVDTVKKVLELFGLETGRQYDDIRYSHIDDNILELSGVRMYKYILNNYGYALFKPAYIKHINRAVNWRQFICKVGKGGNGEYTSIYSRMRKTSDCVLTGVCYDDDILRPVYDFLKCPRKSVTFEDLIKDIESAISKTFEDTEEWVNSDEFIREEIKANEFEFTEDGRPF